MGRRGYHAEFRHKVLDLAQSGRSVADVARDLDISSETVYAWRRQDRIDQGLALGLTVRMCSGFSDGSDPRSDRHRKVVLYGIRRPARRGRYTRPDGRS